MKFSKILMQGIICLFLLSTLVGCTSFSSNYKGLVVPSKNLILLQKEGSHNGKWQAEDISVSYHYTRSVDVLKISGRIDFADSLKGNFTRLEDFDLWIYFVNSENKIVGNTGTSPFTAFNEIEAAPFEKIVELPADTQAMVFAYSGRASDVGGEGELHHTFWKTPLG